MARTADSLQVIWQIKLQLITEGQLKQKNPLDNPATWWHNPTNPDSLRLSLPAFNKLKKTELENWKFKLDNTIKPKTLLQLEKKFTSPYHIHNSKTIYVYGEQEAIMLVLHGNNLEKYLDNQAS